MIECAAAGVPPHLYYDLTWREIHVLFAAQALRARREHKLTIWGHWQGQSMRRSKRLPELKALMRRFEPQRDMTPKAIRSAIMAMADALGAVVVRKKRGE